MGILAWGKGLDGVDLWNPNDFGISPADKRTVFGLVGKITPPHGLSHEGTIGNPKIGSGHASHVKMGKGELQLYYLASLSLSHRSPIPMELGITGLNG